MKYAIASAALLFISVLATPTPLGSLEERDPDTVKNLPDGDKDCNGNTYSSDDIKTAINFSWQAVRDKKKYKWDHPKGKKTAEYPHRFTPTQMDMAWSDFQLDGCAQSENDANVDGFQEYPITGSSAWQGGSVTAGNDRVVFQVVDDKTAAFCGIIRHPGKDGVANHFQMCDDPAGSTAVAPYAQGTCSFHLTQWDYMGLKDGPRYEVEITMFDDAKNKIGYQSRIGCDDSNPVSVPSALEDDLNVSAESQHDYIAFTLAAQKWPSNGDFGPGDTPNPCSVGHWDGSDYPSVTFPFLIPCDALKADMKSSTAKWIAVLAAAGVVVILRLLLTIRTIETAYKPRSDNIVSCLALS